jgi:hypothetical protein
MLFRRHEDWVFLLIEFVSAGLLKCVASVNRTIYDYHLISLVVLVAATGSRVIFRIYGDPCCRSVPSLTPNICHLTFSTPTLTTRLVQLWKLQWKAEP